MNKHIKGFASLLVLTSLAAAQQGQAQDFEAPRDQYLVEFTEAASGAVSTQAGNRLNLSALRTIGQNSSISLVEVTSDGRIVPAKKNNELVQVDNDPQFCRDLVQSGMAKSCSPNYTLRPLRVPNESDIGNQYWHRSIESAKAWDISTGGANNVVVAVLDTGVDYTHPDLVDNMWRNSGEIPANGIDDDNNGVIDDVFGYNAAARTGNPMDDHDHGTHCAGIIGARGNNGIGIAGVNWSTKIMALKFLRAEGYGYTSDAILALDYMVEMKRRGTNVRVVNNSWGGGGYSKPLADAITRVNAAGIIFTAAAGNSGSDNDVLPQYPANYDVANIISVAASDDNDRLTGFSCFGQESVHIAAPGDVILSTVRGGGYTQMSGTSMATPFVSGALGLLLSVEPQLSVAQAKERLLRSAKPVADLEGLTSTGRLLNLSNLLSKTLPADLDPGPICSYQVSEIAYNPNRAVEQQSVIIPRSGSNWPENQVVSLPFTFPFFSRQFTSITAHVNGVVFFGDADESWDYRSAPFAPRNSIAALYAPFFSAPMQAPIGVRVMKSAERVDIFWNMTHPWNPEAGNVKIYLSLFPNGTIESHLSIGSDRIAKTLQYGSLTGITGEGLQNSATVTHNGFPIVLRGEMGFKFERPEQCVVQSTPIPTPTPPVEPDPTVTPTPEPTPSPTPTPVPSPTPDERANVVGVTLRAQSNKGSGAITQGKRYTLALQSESAGAVTLSTQLNGHSCGIASVFMAESSTLNISGILPKIGKGYKQVTFTANGVSVSAQLKLPKGKRVKNLNRNAACSQLNGKIQKALISAGNR